MQGDGDPASVPPLEQAVDGAPISGKSAGSARHTHPLWMTYRIASTTTRRLSSSGRPPAAVWPAGTGSCGPISAHSASLTSEGYKRERRQHRRAHAQAGMAGQTPGLLVCRAGFVTPVTTRSPAHIPDRLATATRRSRPPGSETGTKLAV